MERLLLLKEMLLPNVQDVQNVQDRPEGYIICNPSVTEIQKLCQIPVERSPVQVLLPLLRALSSSFGFYKAIKSPYLSLEKAQFKNNNLP